MIKKISLLLVILIATNFAVGEAMGLFRKAKGEFRFEDYSNAEKAQAALLKLHPVGSKIDDVMQTIIKAGGICRFSDGKTNERISKIRKSEDFVICWKEKREYLIFSGEWRVVMYPESENLSRYIELKVVKFLEFI